ncbi:MAG: protein kinase [Solirubrobacterales bacterium]|nr:protein kinase [Solirubrobacterales bacterium]
MTAAARASVQPLAPGTTIAPGYEVIEHLRRGNDLDVYDAWSTERLARCAIKALRPDRGDKQRARAALLAEGALLERLSHPHIVRAYETLGEPWPMVVLETLPGATLSVLIAEGPAPASEEVAHLGLQLGSALRYLHRGGHLHLDLKPSNVIADAGRAKLLDLSLARAPGEAEPGIGTWHYLAPEQARGGRLTVAADVWGLGAVLFETATGEAPFDDDPDAFADVPSDPSGTYSEAGPERYPQLERRARRPERVAPVDPALAGAISTCLEPEPADRPSIDALLAALEPIAALPASERRYSRIR